MALPYVDFREIAEIAHDALQMYGTTALFTEEDTKREHPIKTVIYRDVAAASMVQDVQSSAALCLLDPADFMDPYRRPQKYDFLSINLVGFVGIWTLQADPHPIYAGDELPIFIAEIRRN